MQCSQEDDTEEDCHYWTSHFIKNIFHTTIAGVVGTWWLTSEAERLQGCCNVAMKSLLLVIQLERLMEYINQRAFGAY